MSSQWRRLARMGAFAAIALLSPLTAHAQFAYRGMGFFGGGTTWAGGYTFERTSVNFWGNPWLAGGLGSPFGYGMPSNLGYAGPYGLGLGYGYGFELSPVPYPYRTLASFPFFSYVTSDQNSPMPKTIEPGKYVRPPVESLPSDHSHSGLPATSRFSGTREPRRPIVYRANVPSRDPSQQTVPAETETGRLIVTRSQVP